LRLANRLNEVNGFTVWQMNASVSASTGHVDSRNRGLSK